MAVPRGSQSRAGTPISLIAIHTSEGARTAASLAHYLDQPGVEASYHVLVDDTTTTRYLPDEVACWAMLSGNPRSVQICLTGFAAWSRSEWLTHDRMLRQAAIVVAHWCAVHRIPPAKLTPAQVGANARGVCGHWDWTVGKKDGTHTDPGPNFPWDVFMSYVNGGEDDMQADERDALYDVREQMTGSRSSRPPQYPGWSTTAGKLTVVDMLRLLIERLDTVEQKINDIRATSKT
ncbi:MAG: N-acetylmuramoyl-L-alanine amidase [Pseudonocardiaceae bacterium]